jgi:Hypothetical glycosyl hydrolase family 15
LRLAFVRILAIAATLCLVAVVPSHVQTSDYFGGYSGTHLVAANVAARWLTWASTNVNDSPTLRALGVKTMMYTDPNRAMSGQAEFTAGESAFAHDCSGARISARRVGQYLMNPSSPALRAAWKAHVVRYMAAGHFDAVFEDDAANLAYLSGQPCNASQSDWTQATIALQQYLGYPVIYNGLSNFSGQTVSPAIALNATAIGGMMEQCYGVSARQPKSPGTHWIVTENTELAMTRARKLFFCLNNDTSDAGTSTDARLYVYASFLLSYDPAYSVLWELYKGPSQFHVMPETQLVALRPRSALASISDALTASGVYQREYAACYLAARNQGPCVIAVNPDTTAHPLSLSSYHRSLTLTGGSVVDGGTALIGGTPPPAQLAPLSAIIAFQ